MRDIYITRCMMCLNKLFCTDPRKKKSVNVFDEVFDCFVEEKEELERG